MESCDPLGVVDHKYTFSPVMLTAEPQLEYTFLYDIVEGQITLDS